MLSIYIYMYRGIHESKRPGTFPHLAGDGHALQHSVRAEVVELRRGGNLNKDGITLRVRNGIVSVLQPYIPLVGEREL